MRTVSVKTGQSELNGARVTNTRIHARKLYHHVTFLNLYIEDTYMCIHMNIHIIVGKIIVIFGFRAVFQMLLVRLTPSYGPPMLIIDIIIRILDLNFV